MEFKGTTIAAIAIACTAAGAGGAWLLGGTRGPEPVIAAPGMDLSLPAAVDAPRAGDTRAAASTAAPAPSPAAPATVPASPPPARAAIPDTPAGPPVVEPATPDTVPALGRIRAIPSGAPPEVRGDDLQVEGLGPRFDELVVGAESVIGLRIETGVSTTTALVEDAVDATVTRDVLVGGRVAIPAGTRARGSVTLVERGGRLRDPARLRVRFDELTLPDGTRIEIDSDPIYREGDAPGDESAATIGGGAIGGAIIGGILGGARGALIGGTAGAGAGTAAAMATGPDPAMLAAGTPVTIRLLRPIAVVVER